MVICFICVICGPSDSPFPYRLRPPPPERVPPPPVERMVLPPPLEKVERDELEREGVLNVRERVLLRLLLKLLL